MLHHAGAVLLVPDHPPMNELVREGSGILLAPHHTFSHEDPPVPVLGKYGNISASMPPEVICVTGCEGCCLCDGTVWCVNSK